MEQEPIKRGRGRPRKEGSTKVYKNASAPIKKEAGQSADEMALQMASVPSNNHLYKGTRGYKELSEAIKADALDTAISQQMTLLKRVKERGRVRLNDIDEVSATAEEYMTACKMSGVYPTMLGFAAACGLSRTAIYQYIASHSDESASYLDSLRSSWAAILAQMGLSRQCSEPLSIFLLKNSGQNLQDRTEIEVTAKTDPLGTMEDEETLTRRILGSVATPVDDYTIEDDM